MPVWSVERVHVTGFALGFACVLGFMFAVATPVRAGDVVVIAPGDDPGFMHHSIDWLEDPTGMLSLDDVRGRADEFRPNEGDIFNPGVSNSVIWVRFSIENVGDEAGEWVISLDRFSLDPGEIHLVTPVRVQQLLENTTDSFRTSYRHFGTLAGSIRLEPHESADVFVRYRGANWSGLQPSLREAEAFERSRLARLAIFLLLLGGVGMLLLYGAVSFAFMGVQIVVLYVIAQLGLLVFYAHMTGFTTVYLWPEHPQAGRVVAPIGFIVFVTAMAQFARRFFETPGRTPRFDRLLLGVVVLGVVSIVTMPLDYAWAGFDRSLPLALGYGVTVATWLLLPGVAIYATWRWHRDFWPLAMAWASMATIMISMTGVWLGIVNTLPLGKNIYGLAVFTEAFFVALAIALRIRTLKVDALTTEKKLGESLMKQLEESRRATRLAEEREWALQDLAEKGRLLLAAGHDTRQMLSALRSYAAGLRLGGVAEEDIAQVSREIEQVASALGEVFTSAVEGSRSGGIADRTLALDTLTASSILGPLELIHGRKASDAGLELRIRKNDWLLVTDRVLVLRVLSNLLSNAIKYTSSGRILVGCRPWRGGHRFQVWDTGPGIEATALLRLLDPQSGELRLQDTGEGVGAGMGIALSLARRLGGRIAARSVPGKGSMFELLLPGKTHAACEAAWSVGQVVSIDADAEHTAQLERLADELGWEMDSFADLDLARPAIDSVQHARCLVLVDERVVLDETDRVALGRWGDSIGAVICVLTYDRSAEARARHGELGDVILYRPVSAQALEAARSVSGAAFSGDGPARFGAGRNGDNPERSR